MRFADGRKAGAQTAGATQWFLGRWSQTAPRACACPAGAPWPVRPRAARPSVVRARCSPRRGGPRRRTPCEEDCFISCATSFRPSAATLGIRYEETVYRGSGSRLGRRRSAGRGGEIASPGPSTAARPRAWTSRAFPFATWTTSSPARPPPTAKRTLNRSPGSVPFASIGSDSETNHRISDCCWGPFPCMPRWRNWPTAAPFPVATVMACATYPGDLLRCGEHARQVALCRD